MSTLKCGCTPDASGYGYCSACTKTLQTKIWKRMSAKDKAYDRYMAPDQCKELDSYVREEADCSCHINPPCSYCVEKENNDE